MTCTATGNVEDRRKSSADVTELEIH
jgi:hypothetical protein